MMSMMVRMVLLLVYVECVIYVVVCALLLGMRVGVDNVDEVGDVGCIGGIICGAGGA